MLIGFILLVVFGVFIRILRKKIGKYNVIKQLGSKGKEGTTFLVENKRVKINFEDSVPPKSKDYWDGFRIGLVKIK